MTWTPEDALWRLRADYPDNQRWADAFERVKDDLVCALAHIATLTAQQRACEEERAGLVAEITELRELLAHESYLRAFSEQTAYAAVETLIERVAAGRTATEGE